MLSRFNVILATTPNGDIGYKGKIPWDIKDEIQHFRITTKGMGNNCVIMGRKTWDSLPAEARPLKDRQNIIMTRGDARELRNKFPSCFFVNSFKEALEVAVSGNFRETWVVGGSDIYNLALTDYLYLCDKIVHTIVKTTSMNTNLFDARVNIRLFKDFPSKSVKNTVEYVVKEYVPGEIHAENQYINLCNNILENGVNVNNRRTGKVVRTVAFPKELSFDLRKGFPALTTKKMALKNTVRELLWFLSGNTDSKVLEQQGCTFWKLNSEEKELKKLGLAWKDGDCGPIYSFQWRHAGARYTGCDADYTGQGVDQIKILIDQIKNNPTSRRLILSAWNVKDLDQMCLNPCHVMAQFIVEQEEGLPAYLSCKLTQRSADVFLGLPINIASYALLTHILAKTCDLKPKTLVISLGDAHIYSDHTSSVKKQITRTPLPFCKLNIDVNRMPSVDQLKVEHFVFENYISHDPLRGDMAV